jgi:hypothetical protein
MRRLALAFAVTGAMTASASAMDFDSYKKLTNEAIKEVIGGKIADADASLARLDKLMAIGLEGVAERAKAAPEDAKLMQLVTSSAPAMKTMKPEELEEAWGYEGNAGDAIGRPLKSIDQFAMTRNYLDTVVHPARAYTFVKDYVATKNAQDLEEAKGELNEVLEHVKKIQTAAHSNLTE